VPLPADEQRRLEVVRGQALADLAQGATTVSAAKPVCHGIVVLSLFCIVVWRSCAASRCRPGARGDTVTVARLVYHGIIVASLFCSVAWRSCAARHLLT
jgi:hypothetical protein